MSLAGGELMSKMNLARELEFAKSLYGDLAQSACNSLKGLIQRHRVSLVDGDLKYLSGGWYVTHAGLLRLAERRHCAGIHVRPVLKSCEPASVRWVFRAVVFKSHFCEGFIGYGDADPSNVSPVVRGAEMRMAETRAVNRALRKAYGIGICSVEEIGPFPQSAPSHDGRKKIPARSTIHANGNRLQPRLRDRLCQLIRQHQLDPVLVKSYALEFCGTKTLSEASREQIEQFINHLSDSAVKDKNALLRQLNSYFQPREGAA